MKKINPQATREAQELFDAIARTLPTRWEKTDIVVMDQVVVKGPGYKVEDCRSGRDTQPHMLARVKKVVSLHPLIRGRLDLRLVANTQGDL